MVTVRISFIYSLVYSFNHFIHPFIHLFIVHSWLRELILCVLLYFSELHASSYVHCDSKKTCHSTCVHNFVGSWLIFKILLHSDWAVNLLQNFIRTPHHTLDVSLHYLVKHECLNWNIFHWHWWSHTQMHLKHFKLKCWRVLSTIKSNYSVFILRFKMLKIKAKSLVQLWSILCQTKLSHHL